MFREGLSRRVTSAVVLVTFTALTLRPLEVVAQIRVPSRAHAASDTGDERYARTLNDIHELLKELAPAQAMPEAFRLRKELEKRKTERSVRAIGPDIQITVEEPIVAPKVDVAATLNALRGKFRELERLESAADRSFAAIERYLKEKNLPAEILARHQAAVAEYDSRKAEFKRLAAAVEEAAAKGEELSAPLSALSAFMSKYPNQKGHTFTDPNNLPWRSPKPVERKPATTREEFRKLGLFGEPVMVAQAGSLSGIALPAMQPPATPTPEDLAETEDVQITQPIRDLAAALENNPVKIFNWVRNNVEFVPSYGSIQGSDLALQTKRGNAFDTASLLIALLRAANIPARYVYGTIEAPADQVMNWVGGVTVPEAAQNLMGQGGIPNLGVASGGQITAIRLEHVWVEAFVDWIPSRGAVHRQGDTWVPMDGSFKQYSYTQGMSIQQNVPFDVQNFLDAIRQGAEVNEAEGWVRNANQALIQSTLSDYQSQVQSYINAQNPSATTGAVLGSKRIVQESPAVLAGSLRYKTLVTGAKFATLPENLRWKFRYSVYASDLDLASENPFISFTRSTPQIGGKKITLSFMPATQADQDLIGSFLPSPNPDGSPIRPEQLPSSLPGYLIRLVPELRLGGQVVAPGLAFTMGQELVQVAASYDPARGWDLAEKNRLVAGEYLATALNLQGVAVGQLQQLKNTIDQTRSQIEAQQVALLTKEEIAGDLLHAAAMTYLAATGTASLVGSRASNVVDYVGIGFGNATTIVQPRLFFGLPREVVFSGIQLDIDRLTSVGVAKDDSNPTLVAHRRAIGSQGSAYEHLIPELLFTTPTNPGEGVSAVKAISRAAQAGQRVYTITQANLASALPSLAIGSEIKAEIGNAVASGKEVHVHESSVAVGAWIGVGYVIADPITGAGAYKISGGANGGVLILSILAVIVIMALASLAFIALLAGSAVALVAGVAGAIATYVIPILYDLDPIALSTVRLIGLAILTLGVGSLMGAIGSVVLALRLFAPVVLGALTLLAQLIASIFARAPSQTVVAQRGQSRRQWANVSSILPQPPS